MGISEEKNIGTIEVNSVPSEPQLDDAGFKRGLGRRQVTMITFGAGIGTGLWVGSGQALLKGGPAGIAIAYTVMAFMVYLMYQSIGEMTAYKPVHGGFIRQSLEYVGPAWAFALGLNFCFNWIVVFPAEVVAAVSILKFWPNDVPDAAWVTIFVVILIVGNLFPVKVYGEIEYWMSMVKLLAVAGMIFFLLISTCGGVPGHGSIGFQFWKNPGPFNFGFKGVCAAFVQAGFSFGGGEHIAVIAGETAEPRKTVKQTIKPVF